MIKVLVTGGGGFIGSAIVRLLLERGCEVLVVGRNRYRHIEDLGATCLVGDIADINFINQACSDIDTVFHTAAKAGIWGAWPDYRKTNIEGSKNVVDSCLTKGVRNLVYTSTPSVVFDRGDIENGDESLPYPTKYLCNYAKSKVIAEKYVLGANGPSLRTCAIRPHLVWGPGDPHLVPRLIEKGRAGALKIVGSGDNLVDITYIENVAHAHILAAESLEKSDVAAGQAYFIGQERPVNLWDWINTLYGDLDIPEISKRVPFRLAYIVGAIFESCYFMMKIKTEPAMTRFLAGQLGRSHYFSHEKASRDIGYEPIISLEEGHERLLAWLHNT